MVTDVLPISGTKVAVIKLVLVSGTKATLREGKQGGLVVTEVIVLFHELKLS